MIEKKEITEREALGVGWEPSVLCAETVFSEPPGPLGALPICVK